LCAFGIRCVIASSFGPLFYGNCFKSGLVPVTLSEAEVRDLANECTPGAPLVTLDLARRELRSPQGRRIEFAIPAFRFQQLMHKLDEIDMTLQSREAIDAYQKRAAAARPWLLDRPLQDS
jgi:3-isopropylmalate/(R)-2-methylmalate dehydratase small subunit